MSTAEVAEARRLARSWVGTAEASF